MRRTGDWIVVLAIGWGLSAWAAGASAAVRNDIHYSCYAHAKLEAHQPALSGRELMVIIDQTMHMDESLQRSAWRHITRYVRPGDNVRLYQFSAFVQGHYLRLQFAGQLESPLEGRIRNRIGMNSLKQLDACLTGQMKFFREHFGEAFRTSFAPPGTNIDRTDILSSLQKIAADMAARPVAERVVLLLSDMLEHSDNISFYRSGHIRDIDPQAELEKARPLFTDFGGARVYVHGAGLVDGEAAGAYRSGETLRKLEQFWRDYFNHSNASLKGFGTPELLTELQ